jgi:hypothetical protein
MMKLWAEGKLRGSADEVNAVFRKLALPSVKALLS